MARDIAVGGLMQISQATVEVGVIAIACLVATLARMLQATNQHYEQMAMQKALRQVERE
jgi:hypothetical protein